MLYSRFPIGKPLTQSLMQANNIGAVIAADPTKVWGWDSDAYGTMPDFSAIDQQIAEAGALPIHLHPVLCRKNTAQKNDFERLHGRVSGLAMPIIERYAEIGARITIAQELCLCKAELWEEIVELCSLIKSRYPGLELWMGDYAIRNAMDRDGILTRLEDVAELIDGFVCTDYTDLSRQGNPIAQWLRIHGAGASAMVSTRRFNYLSEFWKQLRAVGIKNIALETAAIADTDTEEVRAAQTQIYNCLLAMCNQQAVDLWLWHLCDEVRTVNWDPERVVYAGIWSSDGGKRLGVEV